MVWQPLINLI